MRFDIDIVFALAELALGVIAAAHVVHYFSPHGWWIVLLVLVVSRAQRDR